MERFDVLVIGAGSGMLVASAALNSGLQTAVVENGPMGGTCLNRGCVPSKMLFYPADLATLIRESGKLGVNASLNSINFGNIMTRMRKLVSEDSEASARAVESTPGLSWFKDVGEFVGDYMLKAGSETIIGEKIFIVSGARPKIPIIRGLDNVDYLTSDTVLELEAPPKSIVVLGGGYVGVEYAHFFSGIGTKTTLIQRPMKLLKGEEPEVSDLLKLLLDKRIDIFTGYEVVEVKQQSEFKTIVARNLNDGSLKEVKSEALMVAAGRMPNSDLLKPERTGVKVNERGFIKVNEYLETGKKNIWAFGDAIGKYMFKHVANYEAGIAWHNAIHEHKAKVNYFSVPRAVFSEPQVASVGLGEAQAKQEHKILVGTALYKNTAMGAAMGNVDGFVKVIVERETGKILGGHIIGPQASVLIQEVVNAMNTDDGTFAPISRSMHIHPAMPEVVQNAFGNLRPV